MRIGAAAKNLGVSPDFIRALEARGAVPPIGRDCNGHRRLTSEDLDRLRRVIFRSSAVSADDLERWARGQGLGD